MVQFIGGEPMLHPGLSVLVERALDQGLRVEVFTNLVHVPAALWSLLERDGVSLATSYYSDDPAEHAAITGRPSHARVRSELEADFAAREPATDGRGKDGLCDPLCGPSCGPACNPSCWPTGTGPCTPNGGCQPNYD